MKAANAIEALQSPVTGDGIAADNARWTFGGDVHEQFDAHVSKSVPLYREGHELTLALSDYFVKEDSVCYELGTSTGALIGRLARRHQDRSAARFIGIDVEAAMLDHARQKHASARNLAFQWAEAESFEYEPSDLIVAYYTIQFIHPKKRQALFDKLYRALEWGGALVMFEKVRAADARFQDITTTLYHQFKLDQGYSPEEVVAKTQSLKGILEPFSTRANYEFLERAGFKDIMTVQKYLCFEGILAIK